MVAEVLYRKIYEQKIGGQRKLSAEILQCRVTEIILIHIIFCCKCRDKAGNKQSCVYKKYIKSISCCLQTTKKMLAFVIFGLFLCNFGYKKNKKIF